MKNRIALILDLDGVVVDTVEPLYNIYLNILKGFNLQGRREDFDFLNGKNLDEIVAFLIDKYGAFAGEHELRYLFVSNFQSLYANVRLIDGVLPILQRLKQRQVSLALVSSAKRPIIEAVLEKFEIRQYFDFIVSGDDVAGAKPCPDIYLLAKQRFDDWQCYAVEDSENGILSAQQAGLVPILFNPREAQPDYRYPYKINHLSQIEEIICGNGPIIVSVCKQLEIKLEYQGIIVPQAEEHQADELWHRECEKNPALFNGKVVAYRSHVVLPDEHIEIKGYISEYKYVVAQVLNEQLKIIKPIGVSGITIDRSGRVLLGKRSDSVTEYKGYWEFVPSGNIAADDTDNKSYIDQVRTELWEEAGIPIDNIAEIKPFCLIYDKEHGVFDIGVKIMLDMAVDIETLTSSEYACFICLSDTELNEFIGRERVVPVTRILYEYLITHSAV